MSAPARDYSSPYDELFDVFFSSAFTMDEGRVLDAKFTQDKTLSWAAKKAADSAFQDVNGTNVRNPAVRTNVLGAFRFGWDKETKEYVMTTEALTKMAACLEAHGYTVQMEG